MPRSEESLRAVQLAVLLQQLRRELAREERLWGLAHSLEPLERRLFDLVEPGSEQAPQTWQEARERWDSLQGALRQGMGRLRHRARERAEARVRQVQAGLLSALEQSLTDDFERTVFGEEDEEFGDLDQD